MPKNEAQPAEVTGMEAAAKLFAPEIDTLRGDLRDAMLDQLRNATPFNQVDEQRQRDIATAIDWAATEFCKRAVTLIASEGFSDVQAKLEQITVKDGVKIVATGHHTDDTLATLGHMVGQQIIIRLADASMTDGQRAPARVDVDQPELLTEDNSDLADAADEPEAGDLVDGPEEQLVSG